MLILTRLLQFLPEHARSHAPWFFHTAREEMALTWFAAGTAWILRRRALPLQRSAGRLRSASMAHLLGNSRWRASARTVRAAGILWMDRGSARLGAAVAFYSIFSLAPLLMIAVHLAGAFLGPDFARDQFLDQVAALMGDKTAAVVDTMIDAALASDKGGWAGVTSVVTLVIGATGVLVELRNALDAIHRTELAGGLSAMVRARLWALALVLAIGFLLLISLIASSIIAALGAWIVDLYPVLAVLTIVLNWTLSLAILAALFGLLLRWLPSQRQTWSSVWPGAILASVLMTVGKELLGLYLGRAAFSDAFGAAGSLVVLVMWIYYSVQVFLFGAAFNEVRTQGRASRTAPVAASGANEHLGGVGA
jgi:membrane protein